MKKDEKRLIKWPLYTILGVTVMGGYMQILTMAQYLTLVIAELTLLLAVLKEKEDDEDDEEREE